MAGTPDVISGTFAGRYLVDRELGSGATATVYLARDTHRGRLVAIKLLKPELAETLGAERFLREIKVNEQLHHPHIVPVLDSGAHGSQLYFVLPHMEHGSLRQMLQLEKQLPVQTAISIARTIADALDYAHRQGLVHRDVKPENILFTSSQACLADFGIARAIERAIDESTTETGLVRGTPAYMSPEQASGSRHYDGRSDTYSLACVLYEMLAGVPAFIGPTPEAVIAQRFQHAPRKLDVYRSTVPTGVAAAIERELSLTPADRHGSAGEFAAALEAGMRTVAVVETRPSGPHPTARKRLAVAGVVLAAALTIAIASFAGGSGSWGARASSTDTSAYVILPVESDSSLPATQAYDLLQQAMARWSGIRVPSRFEVRDVIGDGARTDDRNAQRLATRLGTGRYVRAQLTRNGSELRVLATLRDSRDGSRLAEASIGLPLDLRGVDTAFNRLADLLLLRGDTVTATSRTLPAVQAFLEGRRAFREFDLRRADSLFVRAAELDPEFAQAALWLAQVRVWRAEPATAWRTWAERAQVDAGLSARDARLAAALVALGKEQYAAACAIYDRMRAEDEQDYVAWYGLGECHHRDNLVVRDSRSPSGWRFRSSRRRAAMAYARAFEVAPTSHVGFVPGSYALVQERVMADGPRVLPGVAAAPNATRFLAVAVWMNDSLTTVPYPRQMFQSGNVPFDFASRARALEAQHVVFTRIARVWSSAMPGSAGAKEAVAVSLAIGGDPAAIDTLRLARALTAGGAPQLRLAIEEVLVRISTGRRDPARLRAAAALADSLLEHVTPVSAEEAEMLAPIATISGRCATGSSLAAEASLPSSATALGVPHFVYSAAESLNVRYVLGCNTARDDRAMQRILDLATSGAGARLDHNQAEYALFGRSLPLQTPFDSARLRRIAGTSGDYLLRTEFEAAAGDTSSVRRTLASLRLTRRASGMGRVSTDALLAEARSWMAIGDTASTIEWLDEILNRASWLEALWNGHVLAASLIRAAATRAELASAQHDSSTAVQWSGFVATLWGRADAELRPVVRQMEQINRN